MRLRLKLPFLMALLIFLNLLSYGQSVPIKGKIIDEKNVPLANASILVKGSRVGAASKDDGSFQLNINPVGKTTLVVTMTGYLSKEVEVDAKTGYVQITLTASASTMDAVVISALGQTRKARSVPYSSQSVDPNNMTEARDINLANTLAGKVAGLQVTGTGQPGSSSRLILRGENSLTGSNQPIWVVDGVIISNKTGENGNLDYGNAAQDLNPDDIESMEVLKGPNAAALYGSQAANGAILITTKKGKVGDKNFGVSLNQNYLTYTVTEWPDYQNVYGEGTNGRFAQGGDRIIPGTNAVNMGSINTQSWGMPMLGQPYNTYDGKPHGYWPQTNNVKDFYQSPYVNTTNIAINKSDQVSTFRLSYGFTKSNDVVDNINLKTKHNLSFYASRKLNSKVTADAKVMYTNDKTKNRMTRNLTPGNPLVLFVYQPRSIDMASLYPYKDADGNALIFTGSNGQQLLSDTENPYWSIYENENEDAHNRIIGSTSLNVDIFSWLKARALIAGDLNFGEYYIYNELGGKKTPTGNYTNNMSSDQNWNYEGQLIYNKKINADFNINGVVGVNYTSFNARSRTSSVGSLLVHDMPAISNSKIAPSASEFWGRRKSASVYGSATLGFRDYLFLDVTGRNEWSSTLPKGKNDFFYPSVGGSFLFSHFIRKNDILSSGKLRASWAKVGGSPNMYQLLETYNLGGFYVSNPYLVYTDQKKNPNLKPEQTVSRELGVDLAFFNNRITLNATVYKSNTTNQILTVNTPKETGFNTRVLNAGEIQNKGIELTLGATPIRTKKFQWNTMVNFSKNDNLVKSLVPGVNSVNLGQNLGVTVYAEVGKSYGTMRGNAPYKVGDTIIVGSNGRTIADPNVLAGNFRPKWLGSFSNSFRYGAFDASVMVTVKYGGSLYSATYGRAMFQGTTVQSLTGRDEWLMSQTILGENDNERKNIGQTVGSTVTRYADSARVKGLRYPNAYMAKVDARGNQMLDKNGRLIPGDPLPAWIYPQLVNGNDKVTNDVPSLTYDATSIKVSEVIVGYTFPKKLVSKIKMQNARIAFVGRNLWQIYKNTPLGIDPEAAANSGNAQGIEAGGSFPYASWGFDLKLSF
ncbi:SusC/RagA family TonB-linked outer membrane protein [Pinibacter aurantiacus]|uniref:SusC/RagA family TonB-linked outer membrane protein n=1 Tax=Pinibacter aurantiacus TaxID=2851599 RepID=A0A9E2S7Z5_9BACT|nr:SusC/RagA family TonB-linked outer membrane protein [Pinibacter aurantiacus]MBV4357566.1 SusC/RagA family TonB-linked outer membrane protein [Pinibacter aurantiacus]